MSEEFEFINSICWEVTVGVKKTDDGFVEIEAEIVLIKKTVKNSITIATSFFLSDISFLLEKGKPY